MKSMNKQDHKTLCDIRSKGQLNYTDDQMSRNAYGKAYNTTSEQSVLNDVATINEIMHRYDDSFTEFKSFTDNQQIRYEHHWTSSFTGVGYTKLDHLLHGLPLGNYDNDTIARYDAKAKIIDVEFVNIDSLNRPVFKALNTPTTYFGALDILFPYGELKRDVLKKVTADDLVYFGSSFDCEPMGTVADNLRIV